MICQVPQVPQAADQGAKPSHARQQERVYLPSPRFVRVNNGWVPTLQPGDRVRCWFGRRTRNGRIGYVVAVSGSRVKVRFCSYARGSSRGSGTGIHRRTVRTLPANAVSYEPSPATIEDVALAVRRSWHDSNLRNRLRLSRANLGRDAAGCAWEAVQESAIRVVSAGAWSAAIGEAHATGAV